LQLSGLGRGKTRERHMFAGFGILPSLNTAGNCWVKKLWVPQSRERLQSSFVFHGLCVTLRYTSSQPFG